mgnify:CR=1 FL=1
MDQTYAYGSNGKMSKIIDAKKNGYQITYTGEKAERFIRPNGEYQQLSYGDGTTTVSSHKADGTKTAQDSMSFDKNTGKILKKTDANGIESSYSYDDGGKDGEQNGWVNEYLVRKIKTEVDYQELDAAGLVKFLKTDKEKEETKTVTSYDDHGQPTTVTTTKEGAPDSVEQTTYQDTVQGTTQTTTTTQGEEKETSVIKTDAMGRETENTSKDRKGNILSSTETSYDFMGRAIQTKVTSDGVTQTESKTYDDNGTVATKTMRGCDAMMTSGWSGIAGLYTAYDYNLLTNVLRNEWGFQGYVVTDYDQGNSANDDAAVNRMVRAGNDQHMLDMTLSPGAYTSLDTATGVNALRKAVKNTLFVIANSAQMNGAAPGATIYYAMAPWRMAVVAVDIVIALGVVVGIIANIRRAKDNKRYPENYKPAKKKA